MAIIHQGKNANREKMDRYIEKESQNVRKKLERRRDNIKRENRRIIPIRLLLILASVGLILLFALHPELVQKFAEETHRYCGKLGDAILKGLENLPDAKVSEDLILGLLKILLGFVLYLLSFIPIVLIWLIQISSKVAVPVLCFAIPGLVAFSNVKKLAWKIDKAKDASRFSESYIKGKVIQSMSGEWRILQAGLEGEDAALKLLSRLGNDYHIYTNLLIPYAGKTSETDLIVVGPNGVTIVEVKNYKDALLGDWSDEKLWLEKERGRNNYTDQIYNPVRQVGTHVYRLSHYLSEHGVDEWVNSCVLFVDGSVLLYQVTDENNKLQECPVFRCDEANKLFDYLRPRYPQTGRSSVVSLLNKLIEQQTQG